MEDPEWPSEALRFASQLVSPANLNKAITIIDVGAHKGESLRQFSNLITGELIYFGFEPNPESFALVTHMGERFSETDRLVRFFPTAVGATTGSVDFRIAKASEVSGILTPEPELLERVPTGDHALKGTLEVDQICIDDFIEQNLLSSVDILKIDTEGYDLEVVRGARNSLLNGLLEVVVCEVFFVKYREKQAYFWDLASEFRDLGFSFVNLFDARDTTQGRLYTANAIWVSPRLSSELGYL